MNGIVNLILLPLREHVLLVENPLPFCFRY